MDSLVSPFFPICGEQILFTSRHEKSHINQSVEIDGLFIF